MGELTNLTDRLTHLRERKMGSPAIQGDPDREQKSREQPAVARVNAVRERRFATEYFVIFVYALLSVAVFTQFLLIASLDIF
jgi:nitrate reductase NapE component